MTAQHPSTPCSSYYSLLLSPYANLSLAQGSQWPGGCILHLRASPCGALSLGKKSQWPGGGVPRPRESPYGALSLGKGSQWPGGRVLHSREAPEGHRRLDGQRSVLGSTFRADNERGALHLWRMLSDAAQTG